MKHICLLTSCLLLLSACAPTKVSAPAQGTATTRLPARTIEDVEVFTDGRTPRPHKVLLELHTTRNTRQQAISDLRALAAQEGCQAVIISEIKEHYDEEDPSVPDSMLLPRHIPRMGFGVEASGFCIVYQ